MKMVDKKTYYANMRKKRKQAKELSEKITPLEREELQKIHEVIPQMSDTGYMFCKIQMKNEGLEWLPGLDTKTYKGRKDLGFKVKKWQKSIIKGFTRVKTKNKEWEDDDDGYMYPKVYHLFHTSQVEALDENVQVEWTEEKEVPAHHKETVDWIRSFTKDEQEYDAQDIEAMELIEAQDEDYAVEKSQLVKTQTINFAHQEALIF